MILILAKVIHNLYVSYNLYCVVDNNMFEFGWNNKHALANNMILALQQDKIISMSLQIIPYLRFSSKVV